jgi:hypothetical protein
MVLSDLVREARRRAHLSQAELARRAGVAKSTVGRIETGARAPTADLIERMIRAAGFELDPRLIPSDPETDSLFERSLARTPTQRLADATRAARFVLRGRRSMTSIRAAKSARG